jgi:asparagine N-glycosylation enzyme membrane subunit Stt3
VLSLDDDLIGSRWFVLFGLHNVVAAVEAEHARRVVLRHGGDRYGPDVVGPYTVSLRQVSFAMLVAAVLAFLFVLVWRDPPAFAVFVAALLALATVLAANVQQYRIRDRLSGLGVE